MNFEEPAFLVVGCSASGALEPLALEQPEATAVGIARSYSTDLAKRFSSVLVYETGIRTLRIFQLASKRELDYFVSRTKCVARLVGGNLKRV